MAKKRSKSKAKTKKKTKAQNPGLIMKLFKWGFVAGLWCFIALLAITAWYATELPKLVEKPEFEQRAAIQVKAYDGSDVARYGELKGVSVTIEEIPSHLIYAVMAVEDRRFYQHFGLDPVGLARAMARNVKEGRVVQGGSTITQQLAKNLFLSHERKLKRKIQEALLALWLEHELTKDEILTAYLNRVYLGAGAYGVDAAARTYFDKPAAKLSLYESAMMAGLLKAPSRYSPQSNPSLAARRAKVVLDAMADAGYITEESARNQNMVGQATLSKPSVGQGERYFSDWVTGNLNDMIGAQDRNLEIRTTLIPSIQDAAEKALSEAIRVYGEERAVSQGAVIVMAHDGAILALVGGADFRESQFNRATQALRPPGSAFKPFVYLTALENGWDDNDMISDLPIEEGKYRPENFDGEYYGDITLKDALTHSRNTATVRLMKNVGIGNVISLARNAGIKADMERDLSLALGSSGVPLIELVTAYTMIANEGTPVQPFAILKITDDGGNLLYNRVALTSRDHVVSRLAARDLKGMLANVIEEGTGKNAKLPFDVYGKTGTSQDYRDAWFIGFSDDYTVGVWLGNDDNSPMNHVGGGGIPALIWKDVMLAAHNSGTDRKIEQYTSETEDSSDGFFSMLGRLFNN